MKQEAFDAIWELRKTCSPAYLSYMDEEGYPHTRAMLILEHEQIHTQYLSTNTSSGKIKHFYRIRRPLFTIVIPIIFKVYCSLEILKCALIPRHVHFFGEKALRNTTRWV